MSEKTDALAGWLVQAWAEDIFEGRQLGDDRGWRIADEDEYKQLGEDPYAIDAPIIMAHKDGTFAEIDLDVTVTVTTAEERTARLALLKRMRERHERQQGRGAGTAADRPGTEHGGGPGEGDAA